MFRFATTFKPRLINPSCIAVLQINRSFHKKRPSQTKTTIKGTTTTTAESGKTGGGSQSTSNTHRDMWNKLKHHVTQGIGSLTSDSSSSQLYVNDEDDSLELFAQVEGREVAKPKYKSECISCQASIGRISRYNCCNCGESLCELHYRWHAIPEAQNKNVVVCVKCFDRLDEARFAKRLSVRASRTRDFLSNELNPLVTKEIIDSNADKSKRAGALALRSAGYLPIGSVLKYSVKAANMLVNHREKILEVLGVGEELVLTAQALYNAQVTIERMSIKDLALCLFYLAAEKRGQRGCDPMFEYNEHKGLGLPKDEIINEFLWHIPKLNKFDSSELEIQRLLAQQNMSLLFAETISVPYRPAFYVAVDGSKNRAIVCIRGTHDMNDVVTDLNFDQEIFEYIDPPVSPDGLGDFVDAESISRAYKEQAEYASLLANHDPWELDNVPSSSTDNSHEPPSYEDYLVQERKKQNKKGQQKESGEKGYVHSGIYQAAKYVFNEVFPTIKTLSNSGFEITISGHSLGGGVASLLVLLCKKHIPNIKCYTFGCPPVVDKYLYAETEDCIHSMILGDDMVPRLSYVNVVSLLDDLNNFKDVFIPSFNQDYEAYKQRAKEVWVPRYRIPRKNLYEEPDLNATAMALVDSVLLEEAEKARETKEMSEIVKEAIEKSNPPIVPPRTTLGPTSTTTTTTSSSTDQTDTTTITATTVATAQLTADGDIPPKRPPRSEPEPAMTSTTTTTTMTVVTKKESTVEQIADKDDKEDPIELDEKEKAKENGSEGKEGEETKDKSVQHEVLHCPGSLVHGYYCSGRFMISTIDITHPSLNRIELYYTSMFDNHRRAGYLTSLRSYIQYVKHHKGQDKEGEQNFVKWQKFNERQFCSCCECDFTWNQTSHSTRQQNQDRHNCRECGQLVCDPCSQNRRSLPHHGIYTPTRVCDSCFNKVEYL